MNSTSEVIEELVREAQGGESSAQNELLRRYWSVIEMAVRGRKNRLGPLLSGREQTQDLAQDAALKVLTQLNKQDWQGSSAFAAWIKKLASNEVIDSMRHHRAQKRDIGAEEQSDRTIADPHQQASPESVYDRRNAAADLIGEIQSLPPDQATAVLMSHWGFSHAEIGETIGCSGEAARKIVSRARIKLARQRMSVPAKDS